MPRSERGPERRKTPAGVPGAAPAATSDEVAEERRVGQERRGHGYISYLELCRGLPYERIETILEHCPVQELKPGEILFEPGQANHHLYLLLSGRLEVRLKALDSPLAYTIETGESVGEMSIIDGQPTSAYVVAVEPCKMLAVHESVFWSQISPIPNAIRNLSRQLAERMRRQNDVTLRALEQELRYKQLQKELSAAYEIQVGMLPTRTSLLPEYETVDIHARMDVVKSVGGDLYDAFPLDGRRICLAIGDVSGKGMPAALFMVRTMTLLRAELTRAKGLLESVTRLNQGLCDTNIAHMFVSVFVAVLDVIDGTLEYVNAGHTPVLASLQGGPFEEIHTPEGLIAGVLENTEYKSGALTLQPGDSLVLYTDGVTEARNEAKEFYTLARFKDLLSNHPVDDAAAIVEATFEDVRNFCGSMPRADDVTVLALRFRGPGA